MTLLAQNIEADVAIVGSGFGGALTALALRRCSRSVVLLERGRHPRFAIGESSTPLANLLLEELADRYSLPRIRPLSKWGTWQRTYPEIGCGRKRGFTFYRHDLGAPFADGEEHARQLLVAANPRDEVADTHWYRPDFDAFLVREAESEGALHLDETELRAVRFEGGGALLEGSRKGRPVHVTARFVVDASGPRGFLHRALGLEERPMRWLPPTQGLYAHFTGVERWESRFPAPASGAPPYPPDDAALHHVFPGGWIWVLRFENGITSAGAAVTGSLAASLRLEEGEAAWSRLLKQLPSVAAQFEGARAVTPFAHAPRVAFRAATVVGDGWAMLPSAAGVIDPLLSTGFPLTLLGIQRIVSLLERTWSGAGREEALADYARATLEELDATERLVAALYASMEDFELFKRLSLLYFAAASFSETVRRLGRPERAPGFLLCRDPIFGPELLACAELALTRPTGATREALLARIDAAIAPKDVAGLGDRARRDWYPMRVEDLFAAAPRLGAGEEELQALLERCGFVPPASGSSYHRVARP
jgi:FADH2 O2-dependent halogenase